MDRMTTGVLLAALVTATAAGAQTRAADGDVNGAGDEAHGTLPPQDRATAPPNRSDSFWYARLGYGGVFGDNFTGGPALGFGFRAAYDSFGIDMSFLNFKVPTSSSGVYGSSQSSLAGSLLKLEGLYILKPKANATAYLGGGLSYGGTDVERQSGYSTTNFQTDWHGSGLQGELTVGYEWPRASPLRMFVQADATLPFYTVTSELISFSDRPFAATTSTTEHRYSPSLVISVGLGWQRRRHARP